MVPEYLPAFTAANASAAPKASIAVSRTATARPMRPAAAVEGFVLAVASLCSCVPPGSLATPRCYGPRARGACGHTPRRRIRKLAVCQSRLRSAHAPIAGEDEPRSARYFSRKALMRSSYCAVSCA